MSTTIPILLYHSVSDHSNHDTFTVPPALFDEHVRAVSDAGRTALTLSELANVLNGKRSLPSRPVLVTFDDGFADTRSAVELLLGAGLKATVFVTSGWIGQEGMLASTDVRELAALSEVEVGAHSVTHPRLDELDAAHLANEIVDSRSILEDIAQTPIGSFAYPHGSYDSRTRTAVIDAGFSAAAAVKNALSHTKDDAYALARVTITTSTSSHKLEKLLAGSGAPLAWKRERLRTRGYRSVRRLRRSLGRS